MLELDGAQTTAHTDKPKASKRWSTVSTIGLILLAPLFALFLTSFVFQTYQVSGESMQNTLQNNDRLIVWKGNKSWDELFHKQYVPNRGDIVIVSGDTFNGCETPSGQIVKRIIGLPGERVVYAAGRYTVYNTAHPQGFDPDDAAEYGTDGKAELTDTDDTKVDVTLSRTQLFVSGDHRELSCDSRTFGPVNTDQIAGKLAVRILPLSQVETF